MPAPKLTIPILESGDHLTPARFHRRYCERPDIHQAELIEGVVYVASPVRMIHGEPHGQIITWLNVYRAGRPGLRVGDNVTVFLDADNEVQPAAFLWREEPGGPRLTKDGYLEGAPQLVVEIAASSASYDLHENRRVYRRNGVGEYVVGRVMDGAIDWFRLREGDYELVEPDERGVIESSIFPGLRLHMQKLLHDDLAGVLAELPRPDPGGRSDYSNAPTTKSVHRLNVALDRKGGVLRDQIEVTVTVEHRRVERHGHDRDEQIGVRDRETPAAELAAEPSSFHPTLLLRLEQINAGQAVLPATVLQLVAESRQHFQLDQASDH